MNGANLLVAALENEGLRQLLGVPGQGNLDTVEALRLSTIEFTRHEQTTPFMAATYGRLTGEAGGCVDAGARRAQPDDRRRLRAAGGHDHGQTDH